MNGWGYFAGAIVAFLMAVAMGAAPVFLPDVEPNSSPLAFTILGGMLWIKWRMAKSR